MDSAEYEAGYRHGKAAADSVVMGGRSCITCVGATILGCGGCAMGSQLAEVVYSDAAAQIGGCAGFLLGTAASAGAVTWLDRSASRPTERMAFFAPEYANGFGAGYEKTFKSRRRRAVIAGAVVGALTGVGVMALLAGTMLSGFQLDLTM